MRLGARRYKLWILAAVCLALAVYLPLHVRAGDKTKTEHHSDVYAVQGMLKTLGYHSGAITGSYDSSTAAAVKRFQTSYGLKPNGVVDEQTLRTLLMSYGHAKRPGLHAKQSGMDMGGLLGPGNAGGIGNAGNVGNVGNVGQGGLFNGVPGYNTGNAANPAGAGGGAPAEEESRMVTLVNAARQQAGLPALSVDSSLVNIARTKSRDMVDNNYFSHQSPTYGSPFDMMGRYGVRYTSAGENIACNQNVQSAHEALMNSEGHRRNILDGKFTHIGIGVIDGGPCGKMYTQEFIGK